jgi:hypothetical protein
MKRTGLPLLALSAALHGCGGDSGQPHRPIEPPASRFIHDPAISRLNPEQLRALSMECEKYSPDGTSRGPYDITYCENAIAAWGDSPLQMVTILQPVITTPTPVAPITRPNDSARPP